jgi:hypothetical protein
LISSFAAWLKTSLRPEIGQVDGRERRGQIRQVAVVGVEERLGGERAYVLHQVVHPARAGQRYHSTAPAQADEILHLLEVPHVAGCWNRISARKGQAESRSDRQLLNVPVRPPRGLDREGETVVEVDLRFFDGGKVQRHAFAQRIVGAPAPPLRPFVACPHVLVREDDLGFDDAVGFDAVEVNASDNRLVEELDDV